MLDFTSSLLLPRICFAAVLFTPYSVSGQSGSLKEISKVQLLSSYEGKIDKMLTVSKDDKPPFTFDGICQLFPSDIICCPMGIAQMDISIENHWQNRDTIKKLFGTNYHDEFQLLEKLWQNRGARIDSSLGFLPSDSAKLNLLASQSAVSQWLNKYKVEFIDEDAFEYFLIEQAQKLTSSKIYYDEWKRDSQNSNSDKISLVDSVLAPLTLCYSEIFETVMDSIHQTKKGCFNRFVNVGRYCASDDCKNRLADLFSNYAQDKFYGIQGENRFGIVDHRMADVLAPIWQASAAVNCQCSDNTNWNTAIFGVDIPGGNMLVSDSFVLIGRDELEEKYLDTSKADVIRRLIKLNIDTTLSKKALRLAVTDSLENRICSGKRIVWVGLDKKRQRYHYSRSESGPGKAYSPLYHIDLFITLLGKTKNSGNSMVYILALPDEEFLNIDSFNSQPEKLAAYREVIKSQRDFICKTARRMEKDIKRLTGTKMERITVPLPIYLTSGFSTSDRSSWVDDILSPANGFVENVEGEITYYMPKYILSNGAPYVHYNYGESHDKAVKMLKPYVQNIKEMSYSYDIRSGLHCVGKVLRRK